MERPIRPGAVLYSSVNLDGNGKMTNDDGGQQDGARGAAGKAGRATTVGDSLDHLIGSWSEAEADELDAALAELDRVDSADWQ